MFYYNQSYGCKNFGLVACWNWQYFSTRNISEPNYAIQKQEIANWLKLNEQNKNQTYYFKSNNGKNIILVIFESLESWVLTTKINRTELTPNLNKLLQQENVVFIPHVIPQTRDGRSSDAQFIINTGLLPLNIGAVCYMYPYNSYYSLAEGLRQQSSYYSQVYIGDEASFWNQGMLTEALGFDRLESSFHFNMDDKLSMGLSDDSFFRQLPKKFNMLPQPFYSQCITLSSHVPFTIPEEKKCISLPDNLPGLFIRYSTAINYADNALGILLDSLNNNNLLENTILIITGDHEALTKDQRVLLSKKTAVHGKVEQEPFVPLIITNCDTTLYIADTIHQVDIYPTLLSLMGVNEYCWKGIGCSVFQCKSSTESELYSEEIFAVRNNENYLREALRMSDLIIRSDYFKETNE